MPLGVLTSVPGLTPLLRFIDDLLSTGYSSSRSEREAFVLHMQHVIMMLEGALTSASGTDAQWILSLKIRLAKYLEDLTPSNPSIIRRLRARWIYHEHFIHETKREIDTALRLIELKAMVSLSGGLISLHGGMERLMSTAFGMAPGVRRNSNEIHGEICRCGMRQASHCSDTGNGASGPATTTHWGLSTDEHIIFGDQVLDTAYQNVLHHRRLAQQDRRHTRCLANALDLLVQLLRRAGRVSDALQYSMEVNQLLGTLHQGRSSSPKQGDLELSEPTLRDLDTDTEHGDPTESPSHLSGVALVLGRDTGH